MLPSVACSQFILSLFLAGLDGARCQTGSILSNAILAWIRYQVGSSPNPSDTQLDRKSPRRARTFKAVNVIILLGRPGSSRT